MSHTPEQTDVPAPEPQPLGVLARLAGPDELVAAAEQMRGKGYSRLEAYSPFPIHGIDEALGAKKPILPWVVLTMGLTGMCFGILLQWYVNASPEGAYPFSGYHFDISGKPHWSLPANIPVIFECIIAFSAYTAFFGMLAFNGLPKFSNPLFSNRSFLRATDDGFFLWVDARDPNFGVDTASSALKEVHAEHVETVMSDPSPAPMPQWIGITGMTLAICALLPLAYVAMSRGGTSETPRLALWIDMDWQPKVKTQKIKGNLEGYFADRRSMRLPVEGTVARGRLMEDPRLYYGIEPGDETEETLLQQEDNASPGESNETEQGTTDAQPNDADAPATGAAADPAAAPSDGSAPPVDPNAPPEPDWVQEFPMPVTDAMMQRGRERFEIHCSLCHGLGGQGDGLVAQRALSLEQPTWVQPSNLHQEYIRLQPPGKLYNTITNGIRKMPGYREHISLEDRWAIALYVKALQMQQNAPADMLSEEERTKLPAQK